MNNNYFTYLIMLVFSSSLLSCGTDSETSATKIPLPTSDGSIRIAKWQGNKKAAALFFFDDSTMGQALYGIRIFNAHHLIGTWFVNPGSFYYNKNKEIWEEESKQGNQELANHTMNHTGAANQKEAEYEIGEPSRIIWRVRGHKAYQSLIAFNKGGGTSWNSIAIKPILNKFKNIDRVTTPIGVSMIGQSVKSGSKPSDMLKNYPKALKDSIIFMLSFHGIAEKNGTPPMDYGNAAVWKDYFETFAQKMEQLKSEFWNAGYTQIYKYIQERKTAKTKLVQYSDNEYSVELTSEKDAQLFNEPLTLIVQLPKNWNSCKITQGDNTIAHTISNGLIQFNAIPNSGKIQINR